MTQYEFGNQEIAAAPNNSPDGGVISSQRRPRRSGPIRPRTRGALGGKIDI